jgi:proteasome assembly chaperone (PAC2) family protein
MDPIRRFGKPGLRRPRVVVAFEGWNDACDAASGAAAYFLNEANVEEPFAAIEPEEFFDFQAHRPLVEIDEGGTRKLLWPLTRFYAVRQPQRDHDLIVVIGDEPSHRWKTFGRTVTQVLIEMDAEQVLLLGAFIGQVAHTKPVPLIGVATDPSLVAVHDLMTSSYEGPTGIIGVLQEACREVGLPALSIWAATPHYLAANPNPTAMLALARKASSIMDVALDTSELQRLAAEFRGRVDEAMKASGDLAEYVSELESSDEAERGLTIDPRKSGELVTEIEDFLRGQG